MLFLFTPGTLRDCTIEDNHAGAGGGVEILEAGDIVRIEKCLIRDNQVGSHGGGISFKNGGTLELVRSRLIDNEGGGSGGGIYAQDGILKAVNCVFLGNTVSLAVGDGGGIFRTGAAATDVVVNCLFASNVAADNGGGIFVETSTVQFTNSTLVDNAAGGLGDGIRVTGVSTGQVTMKNGILWDNDGESEQISEESAGDIAVTYSAVQGGWTGTGNINPAGGPAFFDPDGVDNTPGTSDDNYRLQGSSPCIDFGDDTNLPTDEFDVDGDGNISEATPDLDRRNRVLEGNSVIGIEVDMGAYEFPFECPWDCASPEDQAVTIVDLLLLLADWGGESSCEFGDPGTIVSINDLLDLLANWGLCLAPTLGPPESVEDCIDRYGYEDPIVLESCICTVDPEECPD